MKFIIVFLLGSYYIHAYACDIDALRNEIIEEYSSYKNVRNEKGEIGYGRGSNFKVSRNFTYFKKDIFLIADFDMNVKWLRGTKQVARTLIVATIDPHVCEIKEYLRRPKVSKN